MPILTCLTRDFSYLTELSRMRCPSLMLSRQNKIQRSIDGTITSLGIAFILISPEVANGDHLLHLSLMIQSIPFRRMNFEAKEINLLLQLFLEIKERNIKILLCFLGTQILFLYQYLRTILFPLHNYYEINIVFNLFREQDMPRVIMC